MNYERDTIRNLTPYTPGEQPAMNPGGRIVKLNTNENPYPPHELVLQAIRSVDPDSLRRYPPPDAKIFRETAARVHGVTPQHVIATNGGDELLRLAITVFCDPIPRSTEITAADTRRDSGGADPGGESGGPGGGGGGIGISDPTYSLYPVLAQIHDTTITRVPLTDDFSIPDDFPTRLNAAGARLALIVNPHAPSGQLRPLDQLEHIARSFNGVLLIDEAYVDFASHDALPLLDPGAALDNVLLLRSLSKGYSLAGMRFGYGLAHPGLISALHKARDSYNTDIVSQLAATAGLNHRDEIAVTWKKVIEERRRVSEALAQRGYRVLPSQTNFLLVSPPHPFPAREIYTTLKARNVFVRYFDQDRLTDKLRITIGKPEENDLLLTTLDESGFTKNDS